MIPFEFDTPLIKTLFIKYLKTLKSKHPYFTQFVTQNFPLECIVSTTTPDFVVSDQYHSIVCQFTKSGMVDFKREYSYYKMRTLKGRFVAIRGYFPHCKVEGNVVIEPYLVVTSFEIVRGPNIGYAPAPNVSSVIEDEDVKKLIKEVQDNSYKLALKQSREEMSDVSDEEKEDSQALDNVKLEDASAALQKLVVEGVGEMLNDEDEIINYENVDEEELIAQEKIKKMKYEGSEFSEESSNNLEQLKEELVKLAESGAYNNYTTPLLITAANLAIPSDYYTYNKTSKVNHISNL